MLNRFKLFLLLRRHNWLAFRRSPAYEQSMVARIMMVIGAGFMIVYFIFLGTMFGGMASSSDLPGMLLMFMFLKNIKRDHGLNQLIVPIR